MSALVRIALARPYTFLVMAILILVLGGLAAMRASTDIFPAIKVPVIGVAWTFTGLSPDEMAGRVISPYERVLTTTVNDIDHIESTSLVGIGIVKIYFQPDVDIRTATAQVTSVSQSILKQFPPGATPPLIINYSAATVPILQLAMSGKALDEQRLFDLTQNTIRPALISVPGAAIPFPYGGRIRQVQIDLDPAALRARSLSPQDVSLAVAAQNQILPVGTIKIGSYDYNVKLNDAPETVAALNDLPIATSGDTTILMRDVGHVRDGSPPQTNVVHVNGQRAVLSTILKNGAESTLAIVQGVKDRLPIVKETLPSNLKITPINDQSLFVKSAIFGVISEGAIAAGLTSLMILLFLGSWRSTVIIATSIPLAILAAIGGLTLTGQTLNIMTLGGLALAVGILVDDATVTVENINWHLEQGADVRPAILDGANQIATPAFVSLLCICIVFVPMFTLPGVAGFLFVPMAMAVVFAMVASFVLSRTLVPTLALYLLKAPGRGAREDHAPGGNPLARLQRGFANGVVLIRAGYRVLLEMAMARAKVFAAGFLAIMVLSVGLVPFLGRDFFPSVDSGQITLHVRGPVGMRLEEASVLFGRIEDAVRETIPAADLGDVIDNVGIPNSAINLVYSNSGVIGAQDGDVFISLKRGHKPTADYVRGLREILPRQFPGTTFSFLPADIISQILNFGAPAPIDIQVSGPDAEANRGYATDVLRRLRQVRGLADIRLQQPESAPQFGIDVDRQRMSRLGLTERDVTNSLVTALAGSSQVAPNFWLDPQNGVSYPIVAQVPQYWLTSLPSLENLPITGPQGQFQVLGGLATVTRERAAPVVSHHDIQPVIDIFATPQDRDLGAVTADIRKILKDTADALPKGAKVVLRGQAVTMDDAFSGLVFGIVAAVALIYLLIVVNFQSWLDPFVIITALPAALAGICWMLFATGTTVSVPALTGAIMCMGVATANSILVISFARERLLEVGDATQAAIEAGFQRFRPVVMTALAMIIGMTPMALGLGDGGEQNAPLGRAVIGGLLFATTATLFFVPVVFSLVHGRRATAPAEPPAVAAPGGSHA